LVVGLVLGFYVDSNGVLLFLNDTVDYRGIYYLKVFDLQRWWDAGYSQVLVRASVGAEWVFEKINGSVVDFALFWEDCAWCDSDEPGGLFEGLGGAGVIRGCKSGVCLTNFGVALVGFRTDAVGGATVGAMAAGPVSGSVLAYPQVKSSLVEWAELLNREAVVRPVFGVYEEVQRGVYRLRLLALDTWINDAAAVKEAWGRCWR